MPSPLLAAGPLAVPAWLDEPLLPESNTLLVLGLVLVLGAAFGWLAKRVHLPSVTGQILAGFLAGSYGLHLVDEKAVLAELQPLNLFALALIAVAVGSHLNLRRLRNAGRRLTLLLVGELTVLPALVFSALMLLTPLGWGEVALGSSMAALMAAVSIETSPATTLSLVRETRARGILTKTLLASVALSNIACILVFELARAGAVRALEDGVGTFGALAEAGRSLLLSAALGGGIALVVVALTRRTTKPERLVTLSLAAVVLCSGMAGLLETSALLACLVLGLVQTNLIPSREKLIDSALSSFQPAIFAIFFALAGMKLDPKLLVEGGGIALVLFAARAGAKLIVAHGAMRLAEVPERVQRWLGPARLPQASVAIGLVLVAQEEPLLQPGIDLFVAVVLAVVTLNEVVGPVVARIALQRSGEANKDRIRLIDFLHEENITTRLEADSPEQVIEQLTELLIDSHHLSRDAAEPLLASVLDRERQVSTVLGGGLMIPHGVLEEGESMLGVMGISREGLDLPSPDGEPVHCVVLLATPKGQRDRHLEVLAALARSIGTDPTFASRLFSSKTPAHAYEILHGEETEGFNYFLDDTVAGPARYSAAHLRSGASVAPPRSPF